MHTPEKSIDVYIYIFIDKKKKKKTKKKTKKNQKKRSTTRRPNIRWFLFVWLFRERREVIMYYYDLEIAFCSAGVIPISSAIWGNLHNVGIKNRVHAIHVRINGRETEKR